MTSTAPTTIEPVPIVPHALAVPYLPCCGMIGPALSVCEGYRYRRLDIGCRQADGHRLSTDK
jgi:hypothetical protein